MTDVTAADFRMLRPVAVLDANLTSTTVPEAVVPTYAGGTTYALGDRAGPAPVYGDAQTVYESLQNANTGHTQASSPTWWKVVGVVYPVYNSGSSCGVGKIVSNISADVHELYESQVAGNTGNPLSDTTKWLLLGSTNARAMFDETYGSQTTNADSIVAVLTMGVLTTAMYLGYLDAASAHLVQSATGWEKTLYLNSHLVDNWYDFYYEYLVTVSDVVFLDIPPAASGTLTLTITNAGATAKCGIVTVGKPITLGTTQWEILGGFVSYSGTTRDGFGNPTFAPHGVVSKLNFDVDIYKGFESEALRILKQHVDVPTLFILSTDYAMAMLYGSLSAAQVPISISGKTAPIEILGLDLIPPT